MTTDPNDRLKLVTEQGAGGRGLCGNYVWAVCALKKKILLPDQK